MKFRRSPGARAVDSEWHLQRQRARRDYFSVEQASATERVKYNLDTAQITGEENPRTYLWRQAIDIFGTNGTDVRDLRDR